MFKHQGKTRTFRHNLNIASILSFVAGIVNIAGFLSVQKLTTNVTGHFAFFVDEIFKLQLWNGFIYFLYVFFFLLGAFISSLLLEMKIHTNSAVLYTIPILLEIAILSSIAVLGNYLLENNPNLIALGLLFSMGLQNALVTKISNAVVRTTHLTGLFTDLGIEMSQLFFYKEAHQKEKLFASIKLRFTIISFFFMGGILGGLFYSYINLKVLFIACAILVIGLVYDSVKLKLIAFHRKLHSR